MRRIVLGVCVVLLTSCARLKDSRSGPYATPTTMPLDEAIATLEHPDAQGDDLAYAADQVARYGPEAEEAVPGLLRALRYPYSYDARLAAIEAVGAVGPAAVSAVPDLITALQDERWTVRASGAYALGAIGQEAVCSVPALAELLWDTDASVQMHAAGALDVLTGVDLVDEVHQPRPGWPARLERGWSTSERECVVSQAQQWWQETGQHLNWDSDSGACQPREW